MEKQSAPEISVIMSVYNSEAFLEESVESILNQSFKDFEFIITDDCSIDRTPEILRQYADKDKRIVLIMNPENRGLTKNLNSMIDISKGRYIARIDADDVSLPSRLEKQHAYMETHPDTGVLGSEGRIFGEGRRTIFLDRPHSHEEIRAAFAFENLLIHSSAFIKRSVLNDNNIRYDSSLRIIQDYDLWTRLIFLTGFHILPEELVKYRISGSNISIVTEKKRNYREDILRKIYKDYLSASGFNISEERAALHVRMVHSAKLDPEETSGTIRTHLEELLKENGTEGKFDKEYFRYMISKHWYRACTRSASGGLKIFFGYYRSDLRKHFRPGLSLTVRFFIKCLIRY